MTTKTSLCAGAALGALLALGLATGANAQETTITWKGAPQFKHGEFTFKPRGRAFIDYVAQDVDREAGVDFDASNTRLRTGRLGFEGTYSDAWAYKAEVSIGSGEAQWEDLVLEYQPTDSTAIAVGNFKTVSLENLTSARYITFMERGPFNDVLNLGRTLNLQVSTGGANWTAAAAVSGDNINNTDVALSSATGSREQTGVSGRVTFAPVLTDAHQVHLGAWARQRNREDQSNFNYRTRNNTNFGARYVSTGPIGVRDTTVGLEGAWVFNNLSLQSEWANASVEQPAGADADLQAWYLFGSWFLTGEQRNYEPEKGAFGRTKILNPASGSGLGAIELGARYDRADLTEVLGAGEYSAWTVGANWYPHAYVRFMANYTMSENDNPGPIEDVDVRTFQVRAQFDF